MTKCTKQSAVYTPLFFANAGLFVYSGVRCKSQTCSPVAEKNGYHGKISQSQPEQTGPCQVFPAVFAAESDYLPPQPGLGYRYHVYPYEKGIYVPDGHY